MYDLVDIVLRDKQTLHDMQALLRLLQVETRAAHNHIVAVLHKVMYQILQVEQHRAAVDQSDVVHGEGHLQLRILEQRIEDYIGRGVVLKEDRDTHTRTVTLIVDVRYALDLLLVHQVADLLDHLGLVDHIRDLRNDDALTAAGRMLDLGAGTHDDAAAARQKRLLDTLIAVYQRSRREIGTLDVTQQILARAIRIVDIRAAGIHDLSQIVRCHVGSHTHGNTARTVDQKQRDLRRQHRRLLQRIVEVGGPINRLLVYICHHLVGDLLHTGLGITHGSG